MHSASFAGFFTTQLSHTDSSKVRHLCYFHVQVLYYFTPQDGSIFVHSIPHFRYLFRILFKVIILEHLELFLVIYWRLLCLCLLPFNCLKSGTVKYPKNKQEKTQELEDHHQGRNPESGDVCEFQTADSHWICNQLLKMTVSFMSVSLPNFFWSF